MGTKTMDEIAVVMRKFGDEQSTLMDQFERLSFEVKLNQAILARSLSEPGVPRSIPRSQPPPPPLQPPALVTQVRQGRLHRSGFGKIINKLLSLGPVLGWKRSCSRAGGTATTTKEASKPKDPKYCKASSRSMRF